MPSPQEGPTYIVQSGDTLSSIANRFDINADDLQAANGIADPNSLDIGQRLLVPGLDGITGLLTSEVLPFGSSLTQLTREYQADADGLVKLNRVISPSETIAGLKFLVAVDENAAPFTPIHQVQPGETSLEAAIRSGSSPWAIAADNQLAATWDILPGETLYGQLETEEEGTELPVISTVTFNPWPIVQGETMEVRLRAFGAESVTGTFNGETLSFFSEDSETYYSFHGVHAMSDPGPYELQITATGADGSVQTYKQLALLTDGLYGYDPVILVDPIYVDKDTIAEEDAIVNAVLAQITPERYWDGPFQYPIDEPCVNGYFGQRRDYNNGALFYYHTGLDFGVCAQNLNIYAPAAGRVALVESMTVRGNAILIDHGWGVYSGYWHLSEFKVQVGDFVQPGDLLGIIGNTGRSAGPHLHFEMDISGTPVNPETWLAQEYP